MIALDFTRENEIEAFDPLELLEMSIALCLFSTIRKEIKEGIKNLEVMISGGKLRINAKCDVELENKIKKAISSCYIIGHTDFEVHLKRENYE